MPPSKLSPLSFLILGLLRDGIACHGYRMIALYKEASGNVTNPGNFYRELSTLRSGGFVVQTESGDDENRIPYCIAPKGEQEFDRWLCDPSTPENQGQMPAWILFAGRVPRDVRVEILDRLRDRIWIQSKTVEHARADALRAARKNGHGFKYHPAPVLLLRELKHIIADLEFLEEFRAELEAIDDQLPGKKEDGKS